MTGYLLLATALLGVLFLLARAALLAAPSTLARAVRYGGVAAGVLGFAFLALTGRLGIALMLGSMVAPLLLRRRSWSGLGSGLAGAFGTGSGQGASGRTSQVETLFLRMVLDHDSGAMSGEVLHGPLRGRPLDALTPEERLSLLAACRREDLQSASLLEAWLDRMDAGWRAREEEASRRAGGSGAGSSAGAGAGSGGAARGGAMTPAEAYEVLGIAPGATAEDIKDAHRRLMMKVHPDHGGSTYLAAKLNQAKDLLLRT